MAEFNWKLVPVEPTVEMLAALDDRTPYAVRLSLDKSCFEIVFNQSEEWRLQTPDDMQILFQGSEAEAYENYDRLRRMWLYRSMLAAAPDRQ